LELRKQTLLPIAEGFFHKGYQVYLSSRKEKAWLSAKRKGFGFGLRNKGTRARRASQSCWSYKRKGRCPPGKGFFKSSSDSPTANSSSYSWLFFRILP